MHTTTDGFPPVRVVTDGLTVDTRGSVVLDTLGKFVVSRGTG